MGRSVSYLSNSIHEVYFPSTCYDFLSFQDLIEDLRNDLICKLPSLKIADKFESEDHIILENFHCEIAISEYCDLACLSIRVNKYINEYNWNDRNYIPIAENWINKIKHHLDKTIEDITGHRLVKIGSFSNGEGVYQIAKKPDEIKINNVCHNSGGYTYTY